MGKLCGHGGNKASTKQRSRELDYLQGDDVAREERAEAAGPRVKWADEVCDLMSYGDAGKRRKGRCGVDAGG